MRLSTLRTAAVAASVFLAPAALAQTAQPLPFSQDWTNINLITVDGDWSGVPGVVGYNGANPSSTAAVLDPQVVVADLSTTALSVLANKTSPSTESSGGNYEFEIPNPTVAFQGSGTADSPHIIVRVVTTGLRNIRVRYNLRDLDEGTFTPTGGVPTEVDAIQPVALQFRVGTTGDYTNVPTAYVADASLLGATRVTPVDVTLPAAADQQASVDVRFITGNAQGSDEMIGIDDIQITGQVITAGEGTPQNGLAMAVANPVRGTAAVRFSVAEATDVTLALYDVLGRRVAVLAEGTAAGTQTATLATAGLAPGAYVLRLDAGGRSLTQVVSVVR